MGHLLMSDNERHIKILFEMAKRKQLKLTDISEQIGLGYRHIKRLYTQWKQEGDAGLVHKTQNQRNQN